MRFRESDHFQDGLKLGKGYSEKSRKSCIEVIRCDFNSLWTPYKKLSLKYLCERPARIIEDEIESIETMRIVPVFPPNNILEKCVTPMEIYVFYTDVNALEQSLLRQKLQEIAQGQVRHAIDLNDVEDSETFANQLVAKHPEFPTFAVFYDFQPTLLADKIKIVQKLMPLTPTAGNFYTK